MFGLLYKFIGPFYLERGSARRMTRVIMGRIRGNCACRTESYSKPGRILYTGIQTHMENKHGVVCER